jgi:hypothetical protein
MAKTGVKYALVHVGDVCLVFDYEVRGLTFSPDNGTGYMTRQHG